MFPKQVRLVDVGPRDGLQNEAQPVATARKIELVHRLQAAGLREIEVTSFVGPKWVPQMAGNAKVTAGIERRKGVRYAVLTPNLPGFEAALASRSDEVVVFAGASEAFSRCNVNCTIDESVERFRPVVAAAYEHRIKVRAAITLCGLDIESCIDLDALADAGVFISKVLGRLPVSRTGRALLAKKAA